MFPRTKSKLFLMKTRSSSTRELCSRQLASAIIFQPTLCKSLSRRMIIVWKCRLLNIIPNTNVPYLHIAKKTECFRHSAEIRVKFKKMKKNCGHWQYNSQTTYISCICYVSRVIKKTASTFKLHDIHFLTHSI